jgi:hypothetical protein
VTNPAFADLKNRLLRSLAEHKAKLEKADSSHEPTSTSPPPVTAGDTNVPGPVPPTK